MSIGTWGLMTHVRVPVHKFAHCNEEPAALAAAATPCTLELVCGRRHSQDELVRTQPDLTVGPAGWWMAVFTTKTRPPTSV